MSSSVDDSDLRERFRLLRAADEAHIPELRPLLAGAGDPAPAPRPDSLRLGIAAAIVVVVAVTALFVGVGVRKPVPAFDIRWMVSSTTWRGPTDFLLENPARSVLTEVPSFGRLRTLGPSSSADGPGRTVPTMLDEHTTQGE